METNERLFRKTVSITGLPKSFTEVHIAYTRETVEHVYGSDSDIFDRRSLKYIADECI